MARAYESGPQLALHGVVGRHPAPWRTEPREKRGVKRTQNLLPTLYPPRCWIHISGRPRLSPSIYSELTVVEIASPRHPTHCKAIRQQILQYISKTWISYCTVVLLPDGPTMPRWQGPTSPVHSSHFTGSWVAIQHRGEQSLRRIFNHGKIRRYLLPTLCPPRCWIHISGRPRLPRPHPYKTHFLHYATAGFLSNNNGIDIIITGVTSKYLNHI